MEPHNENLLPVRILHIRLIVVVVQRLPRCVCVGGGGTHSCNSLSLAHVGAGRVKSRKWIGSGRRAC